MKTLTATLLLLLAATASVAAQTRDYRAAAIANYRWNFAHGNSGVVESSLATLLEFRAANPETDFSALVGDLHRLSATTTDLGIRYRALLVAMALESPELARRIGMAPDTDASRFRMLADLVRDGQLAHIGNR